jgi:hypothetical protein
MRHFAVPGFLVLAGLLACGGCASQAVVLKPDPIPFVAGGSGQRSAAAWSLWVSQARDVREPGKSGPKAGTLYSRIRKSPQSAYVEPNPEVYIREQLSRYLLSKGWEASGSSSARALLHVEAEDFSFTEEPGSVWDNVSVRVVYTVRLFSPSGQELGHVRLEGASQFESPLDTERQLEKAFSSALADTFDSFSRSDALRSALAQIGG